MASDRSVVGRLLRGTAPGDLARSLTAGGRGIGAAGEVVRIAVGDIWRRDSARSRRELVLGSVWFVLAAGVWAAHWAFAGSDPRGFAKLVVLGAGAFGLQTLLHGWRTRPRLPGWTPAQARKNLLERKA
jgi:hypothetical protein